MIGIPYMGSKRKLAKPIVDYILANNPKTKYFYDLFGGGGAISFEALKRKKIKQVHYNELNTGVVELLKKIITYGVTDEMYQWVDRNTFHKHKCDDTWFGGLVATCWSFGNGGRAYLFSEHNEQIKKPLHEIIVNKCEKSIQEFYELSGLIIDKSLLIKDNIQDRRLDVMNFVKKNSKQRLDLELLQQLEQLEITNLSYEQVNVNTPIDETIIYLDPPYFNTAKYQKEINHDDFIEWVKNSPYKIYVSSYDIPEFYECEQFEHRCTLSATANNKVIEKLFCNREEIFLDRLF